MAFRAVFEKKFRIMKKLETALPASVHPNHLPLTGKAESGKERKTEHTHQSITLEHLAVLQHGTKVSGS